MRRNHKGTGNFQHHFQKMPHIQAKNGPAVRVQIAHCGQSGAKPVRRIEIRNINKTVNFADGAVLLIYGTDFRLENKTGRNSVHIGKLGNFPLHIGRAEGILQTVEAAFLIRNQGGLQFLPPDRMCEISRSQQVYSLDSRPGGQMRYGKLSAGRPRKAGMDM